MPDSPQETAEPFSEAANHRLPRDPVRLAKVLAEQGVYSVIPTIIDVQGRGRGPRVSVRQLPIVCTEGQSTDGSSIPPYGEIQCSDVRIRVDPTAVYPLPGYGGVAVAFGNAMDPVTHRPNPGCFRTCLQQILDRAERSYGLRFLSGLETELFLRPLTGSLEDPWVKGVGPKSNYQRWPDQDPLFDVVDRILSGLAAAGLHVTVAHTEVAPWQMEINTAAADPVRAAQDYMVLRVGLLRLAEQHGYKAMFMAKPVERWNGSGLHTHLSATLSLTGENAFFEADRSLTGIGASFFGGMFECAGALTYLGNLRQEDYLRLNSPGYEAPNSNSMGWANRTCSFRLTGNSRQSYHVEFRAPSPGSAHAFALLIGMIGAGLWGIEQQMAAPPLVDFDTYHRRDGIAQLPGDRENARLAFAACEAMSAAFTPEQFQALSDLTEWPEAVSRSVPEQRGIASNLKRLMRFSIQRDARYEDNRAIQR
jgi:glutamine synthetase